LEALTRPSDKDDGTSTVGATGALLVTVETSLLEGTMKTTIVISMNVDNEWIRINAVLE
jgi:hypothetical protein